MSATFEVRIHVAAAPERVFHATTDLDAASQWMPNFVGIEKLSSGELRPGYRWRETRKMFGKEATEEFEVTRLQRPERLGLRVDGSKGTSGKGEYLFHYTIEPERDGSRVTLVGEIRMPGFFAGLFSRLFSGMFRKACRKDLEALKRHVEADEPR